MTTHFYPLGRYPSLHAIVLLLCAWLMTLTAGAAIEFHLEIDHDCTTPPGYYLCFPEINPNDSTPPPANTAYFIYSHSSTADGPLVASLLPDGENNYSGDYFADYNSLIAELTNSWTLLVTNLTATNYYTFYVSYFTSNSISQAVSLYPTNGQGSVINPPTFLFSGPTNFDSLFLQVSDTNVYALSSNAPVTQTNWVYPEVLDTNDAYNLTASYSKDASTTIVSSTPTNGLHQAFPNWTSTCSVSTYFGSDFTVAPNLPTPPIVPVTGAWTVTGSLKSPRALFPAIQLPGGKVLAPGGEGANYFSTNTAELYDPTAGTWSYTGSMNAGRYGHTANLLTNGQVLVAGGIQSATGNVNSCEVYNPTNGNWSQTGNLTTTRYGHTATLLNTGKVLAVGGQNSNYQTLASAELYNTATGTWTSTGSMPRAHEFQTATLLTNGMVLISGGEDTNGTPTSACELYNPTLGTWAATGSMNTNRTGHIAVLLADGRVLVAGGVNGNFSSIITAEIYDPTTGSWTPTGSLNVRRNAASAVLLTNGNALIAGGDSLLSAEVYVPSSGAWTLVASMHSMRDTFPLVALNSGAVLAAGGFYSGSLVGCELYTYPSSISLPIVLRNPTALPGGGFSFGFTNVPGASFTARATTNLTVPMSNWTVLGAVTEISSGQYQFTDGSATNSKRFYRVSNP